MKRLTFRLTFSLIINGFILILSSSCSHHNQNEILLPELRAAESIMWQQPDSALHILQKMKASHSDNEFQNATWSLLITQAQARCGIKQKSDSVISLAYNYFMKGKDCHRKAMVLNYRALIYFDQNRCDDALKNYLAAEKYIKDTKDYNLAYQIYIWKGTIFMYRNLYDYAIENYQKAYDYSLLTKNKKFIAGANIALARTYSLKKDYRNSSHYYLQSIMADALNPQPYNEIGVLYKNQGKYDSVHLYVDKALVLAKKYGYDISSPYFTKGDSYRLQHKPDSSLYYLLKSAETAVTIYSKRTIYEVLYYLYLDDIKDYKKAMNWHYKYMLCEDSVNCLDKSKAMIEMQEKYERQKLLNEKNELIIERDRNQRIAMLIGLILLGVIFTLTIIYQYLLRKKEQRLQHAVLTLNNNENIISMNEEKISELTELLQKETDDKEGQNEQLKELSLLKEQNDKLLAENVRFKLRIDKSKFNDKADMLYQIQQLTKELSLYKEKDKSSSLSLIRKTPILNDLTMTPRFLESSEWTYIYLEMNNSFNYYVDRLRKRFNNLNEYDIQLCCLIKLHFSISSMATVFAITPTSMSRKKLRLKEQLLKQFDEGEADKKSLDRWLQEY